MDADYAAIDRVNQWGRNRKVVLAHNKRALAGLLGRSSGGCLNERPLNWGEVDVFTYTDEAGSDAVQVAVSQAVNGSVMRLLPTKPESVFVNVIGYNEGELLFSESLTDARSVRLPAKKGDFWQFRVIGNMNVRSVLLATTMRELSSPT